MPQEFHVVRCYACQVFQVHQVKKIPKWSCKMCGEKQSLKKVHGCGSSSDCRRHVQKLNMLTGESPNHDRNVLRSVPGPGYNLQHRGCNEEYQEAETCVNEKPKVENGPSKWHAFIESENQEEMQEDASYHHLDKAKMTWSRPDSHSRGKGKYCEMKTRRKRKREDLDQETSDESWDLQSFHQNRSMVPKGVKTFTTRFQDENNIVPDSQHLGETGSCLAKTSGFGIRQHWLRNADNKIPTISEINDGSNSKWGHFLHDDNDDSDDVVKGDFCYQGDQNEMPTSSYICNIGVQRLESSSQSGFCTAAQSSCYRSKGDINSVTPKSWQGTSPQKDTDVGISSHETFFREESLTAGSGFQEGSDKVVFSLEDDEILNEVLKDEW